MITVLDVYNVGYNLFYYCNEFGTVFNIAAEKIRAKGLSRIKYAVAKSSGRSCSVSKLRYSEQN